MGEKFFAPTYFRILVALKKILIIQTAFIGDVILATPLIENLKDEFPSVQIDFLLRKGNEALLEDHPKVNHVLIWNKKEKYKSLFQIIKRVRKEKYDVVLCVQRFFNAGLITALSGAKMKIGFDKNPLSFSFTKKVKHDLESGKHECERNLELIAQWVKDGKRRPRLYPLPKHFQKVKAFQNTPYICMAPASVWFTKQLAKEKWIELIKQMPQHQIYLLGAPSDEALCKEIITASKHEKTQSLCGQLNLLECAALMEQALMNYVNDSAPMHLASSMNASTTAFFCSTVKEFGFYPLADNSIVAEVEEKLDCRPCGLHGLKTCPKGHFNCAHHINTNKFVV